MANEAMIDAVRADELAARRQVDPKLLAQFRAEVAERMKPSRKLALTVWSLDEVKRDGEEWHNIYGLRLIWSLAVEDDGHPWIHVSVSHADADQLPIIVRLPSYHEQQQVKARVFGDRRWAYSVWPPADQHVNIHPGVLHLYGRLDYAVAAGGDVEPIRYLVVGRRSLPDFTAGTGTI